MKAFYTAHRNPAIKEEIERHMKIITEEVLRTMENVDSIVLSGSFGRGEGSVTRLPNCQYLPINDYDLYVFSNATIPRTTYQYMRDRINDRIHTLSTGRDVTSLHDFHVDVQLIRTRSIDRLSPDMSTFGLKSASRVVWGKDLRSKIPVKKEDVPLKSVGLNALFLNVLGLIHVFEPTYLSKGIPEKKATKFNYECRKVYLSICTALSLFADSLDLYYAKRANLLPNYYYTKFPKLSKIRPNLPQKVAHYTTLKLKSVEFEREEDPILLWFAARSDLKYVLWCLLSRLIGEPFDVSDDFFDFIERNTKEISFHFFEPYLSYALRRRRIPPWSLLIRTLMLMTGILLNANYMRDFYYSNTQIRLNPIQSNLPPLIKIYLAAFFLLFSIKGRNEVDPRALGRARALMSNLYPCICRENDVWKTWNAIKAACELSYETISRDRKLEL